MYPQLLVINQQKLRSYLSIQTHMKKIILHTLVTMAQLHFMQFVKKQMKQKMVKNYSMFIQKMKKANGIEKPGQKIDVCIMNLILN